MKRIITLATLTIFAFAAITAQTCVKDSAYNYNAQNELYSKSYFIYNSNGYQSEGISQVFTNGTWINSSRDLFDWTSTGLQTNRISQNWSGTWNNQVRNTITYNANGDVLTNYNYIWDATNSVWQNNAYHLTYTYNAQGKKTLYLQVYFVNGVSQDSTKHTYTVDANGNTITELREARTAPNTYWQTLQKWEYTFNANNLNDTIYNFIYDALAASWNPVSKAIYVYNASGKIIQNVWQDGNYNNSSKYEYTFDSNDNPLTSNYFQWQQGAWELRYVTTYTHNSNNQMLTYLYQSYNAIAAGVIDNAREFRTYDANSNLTLYIGELWDTNSSLWVPSYKVENFYSCTATAIRELNLNTIKLYPNPVSSVLNIQLETPGTLQIYSAQGKKVAVLTNEESYIYDASQLQNGVYFIHTEHGEVTKFIKQ